jgi:UDP-glucuronate 4-epimerase
MSPFLFTDAILNDRPIKVFNNGDMLRDFTYIDDIIEGVIRCIDKVALPNIEWDAENPDPSCSLAPYRIYNIGNSSPIKLMDFIQSIELACGKEAVKDYLPMQPGDVYQTNADTSALERNIGYKPSKDLFEGIKETVEWFKNYYKY